MSFVRGRGNVRMRRLLKPARIVRRLLMVCLVVCGCFVTTVIYHKLVYKENYKHHIDSILIKAQTETSKYPDEEYYVIPNLILSNTKRDASEDSKLILITQTSISNLYLIGNLSRKWDGQISLAVLTFGSQISHTIHYMLLMRKCFEDVRDKVSFHLLYPIAKPPINLSSVNEMKLDCQLLPVIRDKHMLENFAPGMHYPANVARNVALRYSASDYVLYLDVDFSPSTGMRKDMETFLNKHELIASKKLMYIVPSFETNSSFYNSISKEELISAVANGSARQLSIEKCPLCHARTNFSRWLSLPYPSVLNISYYVDLKRPYEPLFIAAREHFLPWDTRFKGYGFDRFSQVCESYVSGNDFAVMNNAFVIHDGIKTNASYNEWKHKDNKRNQRLFKSTFIPDLKIKYPESNRKCLTRDKLINFA